MVNLAGSPTAGNPHSAKWARELRESRVRTTATLASAIAGSDRKPAFLAGNGISYYGDRGDEVLTEESDSRGDSLLTSVARDWQAAAQPAVDAGARVCVLRTSPVMDRRSEPLKQLRLLFKAGLGARLGDGRQYMPISLAARLGRRRGPPRRARHGLRTVQPRLPRAPDQRRVHRRAGPPAAPARPSSVAPKALLKVGAGRMAAELLGSVNARPAALEAAGYEFRDRDVAGVLRAGLVQTPTALSADSR